MRRVQQPPPQTPHQIAITVLAQLKAEGADAETIEFWEQAVAQCEAELNAAAAERRG
jgi:hypothetical protein